MDPLHLCVALTPLTIYLIFLAVINLRSRPFLIGGFRDAAALAFGISGLMVAGPLELFLPESAAFRFGPYVWLLLLGLYVLSVTLAILSLRPRLVLYNMTFEELRPVLASVVQRLDAKSRWAGDSLDMPELGVHLHVDRLPGLRNVQLVASGANQNFQGWYRLEDALRSVLSETRTQRSRHGISLLLIASLLAVFVTLAVVADRESIAQALQVMLRM